MHVLVYVQYLRAARQLLVCIIGVTSKNLMKKVYAFPIICSELCFLTWVLERMFVLGTPTAYDCLCVLTLTANIQSHSILGTTEVLVIFFL